MDRARFESRIILTYDNFDNTTAYRFELSSQVIDRQNGGSLNGSFDLYLQDSRKVLVSV